MKMETLESRLEQLEQRLARAERRARRMGGLALVMFVGMVAWASMPKSWAQGYGATLANLLSRVTTLENKTQYMSVSGTDVFFTGCNVHIRDGSGNTNGPVNGLGNLIVGYNESRGGGDDRSGSHNIVVGMENNFSSYGGLVVGDLNTISGAFASVSGGQANTASGDFASVSGGQANTASGKLASVSGGLFNTASSNLASVSGGTGNIANGPFASVSGGTGNTASGNLASVSGGTGNTASGFVASVSGGAGITQSTVGGWSAGSQGATTLTDTNVRSP
jgi:hypothetical protein